MTKVYALNQCFSEFGVCQNHLEHLLKYNGWMPSTPSDSVGFRLGLRIYISNKLPGVTDIADLGTTLLML